MSRAYYNEFDPFAAEWLRNLIDQGLIAPGDVDERSITEVTPDDVRHYTQCHFFAGIGGWSAALRLAGWPDARPVWTASLPCQPYSSAGKGLGDKDPRHLWPAFYRLIRECGPATVFGEQVASKAGLEWFDGVSADLEASGYAVGAADLCAAGVGEEVEHGELWRIADHLDGLGYSQLADELREAEIASGGGGGILVGAPHIRQRLWWLADSGGERHDRERLLLQRRGSQQAGTEASRGCKTGRMADAENPQRGRVLDSSQYQAHAQAGGCSRDGGLVNAGSPRPQGQRGHVNDGYEPGRLDADQAGPTAPAGAWSDTITIPCLDGKARRISTQPGDEPLAHGIPRDLGRRFPGLGGLAKSARRNRVGRLKGYGNAIVPEVAAAFIEAYLRVAIENTKPEEQ